MANYTVGDTRLRYVIIANAMPHAAAGGAPPMLLAIAPMFVRPPIQQHMYALMAAVRSGDALINRHGHDDVNA